MPGGGDNEKGLSNKCGICQHDNVLDINFDMANGHSPTAVAVKYDLRLQTLQRHWREHVLTMESEQGLQLITISDVLDIPLQMKERGQLIKAMIDRLLEPMMGMTGPKRGPDWTQLGMIIRLFRLQQLDENVILKITGVLREGGEAAMSADLAMTEQYAMLQGAIDERLAEMAQGDHEAAAQARKLMAEILYPEKEARDKVKHNPFTYTDLGPVEDADGE